MTGLEGLHRWLGGGLGLWAAASCASPVRVGRWEGRSRASSWAGVQTLPPFGLRLGSDSTICTGHLSPAETTVQSPCVPKSRVWLGKLMNVLATAALTQLVLVPSTKFLSCVPQPGRALGVRARGT